MITLPRLIFPDPRAHEVAEVEPREPSLEECEALRITDSSPIPKPTPVIRISGEIISTPEAITVISGQPKSGKSAFCSMLIAGAIAQGEIDGLLEVEVLNNNAKRAVIHFDTEQAPWKQQDNQRTILRRANLSSCPPYYMSYNFRQLDIEELQMYVTTICKTGSADFGGIHSIFIDGIADFIKDPNDPAASFDIVKYFENIAQQYFCPVIVVVHTNPGGDKERGHLGSQVQRKAEGILSIKKEGNVSFIDPKLLRHAGDNIPKIQFRYDYEKSYHTQCYETDPHDRKMLDRINKLQLICTKVFSGQQSYSYADAIQAIVRETARGMNSAKEIFKEMKAHELIVQGTDKNWRGLVV